MFNISSYMPIINNVILAILIIIGITLLTFKISLFKIFIKEERNPYMSLIPVYDYIIYFKVCHIPVWTLFVPVLNIIAIVASPYRLAKQYRCKRYEWSLAIIIPFVYFPYIAFSKLQNKDKKHRFKFYKTQKDIDELERVLLNSPQENIIPKEQKLNYGNDTKTTDFIDKMIYEENDEVITDDVIETKEVEHKNVDNQTKYNLTDDDLIDEEISTTFVEILDDNSKMNTSLLNSLDKNTENPEIKLVNDFKDYEELGPSDKAIAFGGENKIETLTVAKKDELVCPKCGGSLIGATDICPGCATPLKDLYK